MTLEDITGVQEWQRKMFLIVYAERNRIWRNKYAKCCAHY